MSSGWLWAQDKLAVVQHVRPGLCECSGDASEEDGSGSWRRVRGLGGAGQRRCCVAAGTRCLRRGVIACDRGTPARRAARAAKKKSKKYLSSQPARHAATAATRRQAAANTCNTPRQQPMQLATRSLHQHHVSRHAQQPLEDAAAVVADAAARACMCERAQAAVMRVRPYTLVCSSPCSHAPACGPTPTQPQPRTCA